MEISEEIKQARRKNVIDFFGFTDDISDEKLDELYDEFHNVLTPEKQLKEPINNKKNDDIKQDEERLTLKEILARLPPPAIAPQDINNNKIRTYGRNEIDKYVNNIYINPQLYKESVLKYQIIDKNIDHDREFRRYVISRIGHKCDNIIEKIKSKPNIYDAFLEFSVRSAMTQRAKKKMREASNIYLIAMSNLFQSLRLNNYMFDTLNPKILSMRQLYKFYTANLVPDDSYYHEKRIHCQCIGSDSIRHQMRQLVKLKNEYDFYKIAHHSANMICQNHYQKKCQKFAPNLFSGKQIGLFRPPAMEYTILQILDSLNKTIIFFYKHRFDWCKYLKVLEYDFFCLFMVPIPISSKIIPFVIETDEKHHFGANQNVFPSSHRRDILKQYYLRCMNIHLLRIKYDMDPEKQILNFISRICKTDTYIVQNPIEPIPKYFQSDKEVVGLRYFYDHCSKLNNTLNSTNKLHIDDSYIIDIDIDWESIEQFIKELDENDYLTNHSPIDWPSVIELMKID